LLGEAISCIEIVVALTVIAVALFGSQTLSERAFRLLRWFGNRPEPPAPTTQRSAVREPVTGPVKDPGPG